MGWKASLLVLVFALAAHPAALRTPVAAGRELEVEFGHFPQAGAWYQDVYRHEDEKVKVEPKYGENGRVEVTIGLGGLSGTDVTLVFWRNEANTTHVSASAIHHTDAHRAGDSGIRNLSGVEGRVLLKNDDWGPGKSLDCLFSVRCVMNEKPQLLLGAFNLAIPADSGR